MKIRNYTVYSTEDLQAIITASHEAALLIPTRRRRRSKIPTEMVVVYWQGQRQAAHLNVRRDCAVDPERGARALRIKKPDRLSASPLELLAMQANPRLPSQVVAEVAEVLGRLFGVYGEEFDASAFSIRIREEPDLVEDKDEQARRVKAKKVRKAVGAAVSTGLRMGPTIAHIGKKITLLEAVEDLLGADEKELLAALRAQKEGMGAVLRVAAKLKRNGQ